MSLLNNNSGYWGYMNEEVRYAIAQVVDNLGVSADGDLALIGTVAAFDATFTGLINAADDTAAASAGVAVDEIYHNNGALRIRLT